ncbi:TRAP transporter large permease [Marinobacter salinexigens]|uniref:TRAP transporter large permease protein n=1 Tax=Marinobacter salinexigens TaxID=2919747 RepID=A0A5B0VDD4_9GAMM|nr:TRAP transporter large permease [Marinobacter salinexigens]KAA1172318.1 TRAP transporter large permease [Marinobacter salinexigens]
MSDIAIGFTGLASLFSLIALRVPIGIALIIVSFVGIWALIGVEVAMSSLGIIPYNFASNWTLSSVPLFLFLGFICYHAELTQGMFRAARAWLAGIPGGLAIASIFGSAGFAAVSGSSIACSAAMGRIAVPEMIRYKYDPGLATGTVAVAGTIGALIPPSIIMILYGVISQTSVSQLFLGGVAAGVITVVGYVLVVWIRVKLNPDIAHDVTEKVPVEEKIRSLKDTWPLFAIMIGIFGGLFAGVFTPNEAGAVGASLACIVALTKGKLTWKVFKASVLETLVTTSALLIIAVGASLLTRFLVFSGAGDYISDLILSFEASDILIVIGIALIYLALGMFLEPIGAMLLTLPIVLPVIESTQYSLVWFGVVLTKLLEVGMITPPVGMNVFVIKSVVGNLVSTSQIFKGILWFLVMDLVIVAVLIAAPDIIMYLPNLLKS